MLPPELPGKLTSRAVQPPGIPDGWWAWCQGDARLALASLGGSIVAVCQVDAYVVPFGQIEAIHTGRRASYFYQPGELALRFAERTRQLADGFVAAGERDELFVLHFSTQDEADAAYGPTRIAAG
jgi:hypothetical protein